MSRVHPRTGAIIEPMPNYKQILIGKQRVGYVLKGSPISLIKRVDGVELVLIKEAVAAWTGQDEVKVNQPPKLVDKTADESEADSPGILGPDGNQFDEDDEDDEDDDG